MKKVDLNSIDDQRDDALEFYMKKCSEHEEQIRILTERITKLEWQKEEHE